MDKALGLRPAVERLSLCNAHAGDDTWAKLPFYAAHDVDELLIIDPREHSVAWLGLTGGEYRPIERSGLIDLGREQLAEQIAWP